MNIPAPFIVLVTGGRTYDDEFMVWTTLDVLHAQRPITHLMHGEADGADALADRWARARGVQPVRCPALWDYYRRPAGHRRNFAMAQLTPDVAVAFPGGNGTRSMIEIARSAGIEVRQVMPDIAT